MDRKLKNHYDVGIYGWWGHDNFGGCLTYFALNKCIEKMGYSVVMIQEGNGLPVRYNIPDNCIAMQFITKHCDCTRQVDVLDLPQYNDLCDTFIVGGDQMWSFYIPMVKEDNFLNFVHDGKTKLSYSTSFGPANFTPPRSFVDMAKPLLKRFDAISVREDYAVQLANEIYNVNATQVIDAVFLLEKSDFIKVSSDASYNFPKKFLFAFILNPTKEKRMQVESIANKLGLDIVCAPDAAVGYHKTFYELFSGLKVINPLNVSNFLKAYEKASYIVTDSFHGTCFSYIYRKDFSVYFNAQRGADRFVALMKLLSLDNRRIYETQNNEELINNPNIDFNVNWEKADKNIDRERKISLDWLSNALANGNNTNHKYRHDNLTIDILPKNLCTGCSACFNGCPVDAISIVENEQGFYEPLIDNNKCIRCGKCEKICPVLHPNRKNSRDPECYAVMNTNDVRTDSSSGGVFSALADYVLDNGGYVCGAGYDDNFVVEHKIISHKSDIKLLRRSKYVMSKIGDCFRRIKTLLDENKLVLFSGCPCQAGGLNNYLGKKYENLIIVDIVCHGAPSNKMFQKYLEETYGLDQILDFRFRTKNYGYNCTTAEVYKKDGSIEIRDYEFDLYEKVMHSGLALKGSCTECKFAATPRQGDISIGDFWGISKFDTTLNDGLGTSVLLINNSVGKALFNTVKNKFKKVVQVPFEYAKNNNRFSAKIGFPNGRKWFLTMIKNQEFEKAAKYALTKKYNVGLVGLWYSNNLGNMASFYALHYVLTKKLGLSVLTIENSLKDETNFDMPKSYPRLFAETYYDISAKHSLNDLYKLNDYCDGFIVGSDQMWNINLSRPYKQTYFLGFADKDKKKISYGTSFGTKYAGSIHEKIVSNYLLHEFNSISVEDDISKHVAESEFALNNVVQVCDPIFLCPRSEFERLANQASLYKEEKYIFAYIVDPSPEAGKALMHISKQLNCKIFVVFGIDDSRFNENKSKLAINDDTNIEIKANVDLYEWLWYYMHSRAVISDSYYGVMFGLVFNKPFLAKVNYSIGKRRFTSLLTPLGLLENICENYDDIIAKMDLLNYLDYSNINKKIDLISSFSLNWLKNAVKN